MLANQLNQVKVHNPFDHLGTIENAKGNLQTIRAWIPHALKVDVYDFSNDQLLGSLEQIDANGLFEAALKTLTPQTVYYFKVKNDEHEYQVIDPYQFKDHAFHAVHYVNNQPENIYHQLGAQLLELETPAGKIQATRFAVFAPNATAVSVIGDFNYWDGRYHPMQKTNCGHWVLVIPGVQAGARYKYEIKDPMGNQLPHKADPVGFYADQYPSHASIVYDHEQYQWNDENWLKEQAKVDRYKSPMAVYELHAASWKPKYSEKGRELLNYHELADELIQYVKEMGYTHIELMPIAEHPYDGSWGYQPVGLFSPTSRFGKPDDFKYFVDQCHQNGIGVIMDWVPAHFPEDGHGLARFDGTYVYEYEDPRRGWHPDWNSCIYDFGKDTVRQFLIASALIWLDKYHIDGLRVDAVASMLYWDYSRDEGEWVPNIDGGNENYEAVSLLRWFNKEVYQKYPHAFTVAEESTAFPKVSKPVYEGGLGFGFKWNMGWMHDSLHFISKDPAYRKYHHNEITFSMVYAYNENFILPISHDEVVHGKGSMLRKMPGDEWQAAANLRSYAAFMYAHPGKKLNFMGNEIGQTSEWNHAGSVEWFLLEYDKHKGIQNLYKDLNKLYTSYPALYEKDHESGGFEWIEHQDAGQSILSFVRKAQSSEQKVYVISNFTPVPREGYRLGVKEKGQYKLLLSTDRSQYWGSDFGSSELFEAEAQAWQGQEFSIMLDLPPLATVYVLFE
ncbi:1,4-alpha-glucan branching protein GlgB [Catenovulum sp. 2E275]|uniref:1,4-alpha-glucan branching protein GlgB n=1 Tax=Catenovulum sp. 2E275 TaxID=2980497 RepID=UPI0021D31927|nr:1,4-alpha-glucan branching protein GlgB [Catenovulum sp. 2E275]MCU4677370.1 1,4-alpha-glucan branching protein GlgB [Catenovulum sp. 2E275]